MKVATSSAWVVAISSCLGLLIIATACSMRGSPTSPNRSALRITPADGATSVRVDATVVLDLGAVVDRAAVEGGFHVIADADMNRSCPDSAMGPHGTMDTIMNDPAMLRHMDAFHSVHGSYAWNSAGTVCTFHPDSLMHSQSGYMVHLSATMLQMMGRMGGGMMGGTMTGGTMNSAGDMMTHFQTSTSLTTSIASGKKAIEASSVRVAGK